MLRGAILALVGLSTLVGCTTSSGGTAPTTPTLVAVSPQDFTGDVACVDAPGAMRGYVVTLFDLGTADEPQTPFALPSSVVREGDVFRPARCETATAFSFVIPGHRYDAEIDAYDRRDLTALGPGARQLVDAATGAYVAPRWTTSCGRNGAENPADGPVTAAYYLTRFVRGCAPLESLAPPTDTGVRVSLADALGDLECGEGGGQVAAFTVERSDLGTPEPPAPCTGNVEFTGLEPAVLYTFDVKAYEASAPTPRWGTTCYRKAVAGAVVAAACDPLVEIPP
ncbi:MAG: hypothetical protein U0263_31890 [Polyangiaceae bacterium]